MRGTQGTGSLTLSYNYFGMDEQTDANGGKGVGHINVDNYSGNTNGSRAAGTYD